MTDNKARLQALLSGASSSDAHEEDATEFLEDHAITYASHNRQYLLSLAWRHGWRPVGDD